MGFLKKYWFLIILAFFATLLLAWFLLLQPGEEAGPEERAVTSPSWNNITPGQSSLEDVRRLLGSPDAESTIANQTVFSYEPQTGGPPHEVITQDNRVVFIKEQVLGEKNLEGFVQKYGEPEASLWGPHSQAGFKTYVFAQRGLAAVAQAFSGTVIEAWYFAPMPLSQFLSTWGTGLSPQPKESF